ncbi:MAG: sulfotransferase [Bacteroidota bacterium]
MYNYVDVSGYGHSGKSVMIDLLKEIDGFQVPDYFFEFDLLRIPGGLVDLRHNVHDNWSPIRSDAAIKRFRNVAYRMGVESLFSDPKSKLAVYGTQYEKYFRKIFFEETNKYIDSLIQSKSIKHDWPYLRIDESYWVLFFFKTLRKLSLERYFNFKYLTEYLFVDSDGFIEKSQHYLDSLFSVTVSNEKIHTIVLNNTFEPYNPRFSMELFPNSKSIVIRRDPRDIFASTFMPNKGFVPEFLKSPDHWKMKQGFLMVDKLDSFIKNQFLINKSIKIDDNKKILRLRYEDIVLKYDKTLKEILNFLEVDKSKHTLKKKHFDPEKSKLNVGLWKQLSDQNSIRLIEETLSEFCYEI